MSKEIDLDALRALAEAATPGPWRHSPWHIEDVRCEIGWIVTSAFSCTDAAYIAAADPQTILTLIDMVRKAKQATTNG